MASTIIMTLLLLLIILMLSKIKFHIEYHRNRQDDRLLINVAIIKGLFKFHTELNRVELEQRLGKMVMQADTEVKTEIGTMDPGVDKKIKFPLTLKNMGKAYKVFSNMLQFAGVYKKAVLRLAGLTRIREFKWTTDIGAGDAALTGLTTGVVWGVKGMIIQGMYRFAKVAPGKTFVQVRPDFAGTSFNIDLRCIFDIRIGHIIIAGFNMLIIRLQRGSGR